MSILRLLGALVVMPIAIVLRHLRARQEPIVNDPCVPGLAALGRIHNPEGRRKLWCSGCEVSFISTDHAHCWVCGNAVSQPPTQNVVGRLVDSYRSGPGEAT